MKKHFEVVAKCGHVGRGKYYEGKFYIEAEDAKEAAKITRQKGRVKHDHKDAIISVKEITYKQYKHGRNMHDNEAFFNCKSIQEQNAVYDEIKENIKEENKTSYKKEKEKSRKNVYDGKNAIRNPHKYARMCYVNDFSWEVA